MGVDGVHFVLRHGRRTVEHDREARELFFDGVEHVECQGRRNEPASLRVASALFRLELVSTVAGTDGDSEGVAARTGSEVDHFFRLGVVGFFSLDFVFHTGEHAEFSFDGHVVLVSVFNNLLGEGDVVFVRKSGTVDHHGRETVVDAVLAEFERVTVVEVEHDLRIGAAEFLGVFNSTLGHVAEDGAVGVVAGTLRDLHDHRRLLLHSSLHDGLHLFHGVEVESRDSVATLNSLCKHFPGVHQAEFLVRNCHLFYLLILWRLASPVKSYGAKDSIFTLFCPPISSPFRACLSGFLVFTCAPCAMNVY